MLLAIGLVVNFVGFVYDQAWHATHLQIVPILPIKLLSVHSGIYLGALIVTVTVVIAFARRAFDTGGEWAGLVVLAVGLALEFLGDGTDMWAHGHGYERDLFHNFIYSGAGVTVVGYLIIQLVHLLGRAGDPGTEVDADQTTPADPAGTRSS
ncbi:MAG: hypothetical protein WCA46_07605 [Actinocatenispora sp.]